MQVHSHPNFLPLGIATRAAEQITEHFYANRDWYNYNDAKGSQGEAGSYWILESGLSEIVWRELRPLYEKLRGSLALMYGEDVILSPHTMSATGIKVYEGRSAGQGAHYDSNPISALLYLTHGSPFEYLEDGLWKHECPKPGKLLIFEGRKVLHRVPPSEFDGLRISIPMNYYYIGDTYRPHYMDNIIYQNGVTYDHHGKSWDGVNYAEGEVAPGR